jgi:polyisoprenoid-binding protein YceI
MVERMTTSAAALAQGTWSIDPAHSSIHFRIRHIGVAHVRGRFNQYDAQITAGPDGYSVTASVALASIDTGVEARDNHVRSADFLDVDNRPTLTYRSGTVSTVGEKFTVEGEATIGSVTRPVALEASFGGVADGPDGKPRGGFEATGVLKRSEFGIGPDGPMLGDDIHFVLSLEFIAPE